MFRLSADDQAQLATAVADAATRPDAIDAVRRLYDDFEAARAARQPRCDASGDCCRFEAYRHRLFVTTLELAAFATSSAGEPTVNWNGTGCPYQVGSLCVARAGRPFGCRVYFCDDSSTGWQQDQYERFQGRIRELHQELGVPYLYAEWREALSALGLPARHESTNAEAVGKRRIVLTVVPDRR